LIGRLQLNANAASLREAYAVARPFPHVAIDGLFEDDVLDAVLAGFPAPSDPAWAHFENSQENKLGNYGRLEDLSQPIRSFLSALNAPRLLSFLETLTGIDGLIPDPYFGGGALHQIVRGGFLKVHADFNWHPKLRLDRRLNMLVYLNRGWRPEWGGALELWGRETSGPAASILPTFNRTVVFTTTDRSFHGHPHPLACPESTTRKSVSLYYYSNGRPEAERSAPHDTIFPAPSSASGS
jgi:Rps23 Pro-64 3,4-dihydroxylase Tpa1-like proline 4-hydroxylase